MFTPDIAINIKRAAVAFVPMLLGIVCHEVAHGWVAWRRGDNTARFLGRLTLNPVPHLDPAGTLVFILTALTSPFMLGWAKPVPVNPRHFSKPARDMMLVSLAGPAANMLLAVLFAISFKLLTVLMPPDVWHENTVYEFFVRMLGVGVWINVTLAWFNLLPVPPLDGSHVLTYFLPPRIAYQYHKVERFGMVILLALFVTGLVGPILHPLIEGTVDLISTLTGIA